MNWCFLTDFIDSSGRNRTYNPSVNSRRVSVGVRMFSTEYRGAKRREWSLFGAQLDQILDHVFQLIPVLTT
jgi:hypothetical protein